MRKLFRNKLYNNYIMSSRSLAAARARRSGDAVPPVSGNRPVTSIGSQAAFTQQMPQNISYNMPPPPNNVRTAKAIQQQPSFNKKAFTQKHSIPNNQQLSQEIVENYSQLIKEKREKLTIK